MCNLLAMHITCTLIALIIKHVINLHRHILKDHFKYTLPYKNYTKYTKVVLYYN